MKFYRYFVLVFVAGLIAVSHVQSAGLEQTNTHLGSSQAAVTSQTAPTGSTTNGTANQKADNEQGKSSTSGRYLSSVGSYEQQPVTYEAPQTGGGYSSGYKQESSYQQTGYQQPSYQQTGYQQQQPSYQQQQTGYQQTGYQQPSSYQQSSYVAPQASYQPQQQQGYQQTTSYEQQPVYQTYQAPTVSYQSNYTAPSYQPSYQPSYSNYSAPVTGGYSQPGYQQQTSYQQPSYQQPSYQQTSYQAPSYQQTSYQAPSYQQTSYQQPSYQSNYTTQSYQPQSYSNYSAPSYQTPTYQTPSYQTPSYQTPSYQAPSYSAPSYSAPSYSAPSYSAPSYSAPSYSAPSYQPQQQSYSSNYSVPAYQPQPYAATQSYSSPSYSAQSSYSNYSAPVYTPTPTYETQNYTAPSYQQPSYQQQTSYSAPVQTYSAPVQTYSAPESSYQQPSYQQSSYQQQPSYQQQQTGYQQTGYQQQQTGYQQTGYQQPSYQQQQPSYQQPSYQQTSYQQPSYSAPSYSGTYQSSGVHKRQLPDFYEKAAIPAISKSVLLDSEMSMSDSVAYATYAPAPPTYAKPLQSYQQQQPNNSLKYQPSNNYQQQQQQQYQYLDTQPEFTQSWADYGYPPGYLPAAYRNQLYGGSLSPDSLGYGYVTWSGPIDPKTFYTQYQLAHYYRHPPMTPFYSPSPSYLTQQQYQSVPIPALSKSVALSNYVGVFSGPAVVPYRGVAKRSFDQAPYQMLVDHLAAASDKDATFANTTIKCPPKPTDYMCPKVIDSKNKEEIKKQICQYDTILTGAIVLLPDSDQSDTRCGPMAVEKLSLFKNEEDQIDVSDKIAVVYDKSCPVKQLFEGQTAGKKSETRVHVLLKAPMPSGTKFLVMDGTSVDLISAELITRDEMAAAMKTCSAAAANPRTK